MSKKMIGKRRREQLVGWLQSSTTPITGAELANRSNVSRQVIVQDISLLKAQNYPIIATSNGYLFLQQDPSPASYRRVIACKHTPAQTREELYTIVDHGASIEDVIIEHPIYGDLKASLLLDNRMDVDLFVRKIEEEQAPYLLELTDGVHNHTIIANEEQQLDKVFEALKQKGFIVE
ncbi:transcription repressor NadR [Gracilibacillus phocaeensis]|uniref:transcription repressor NadR n=1 Tax=Gracilibacillus phocaeensis TaxID=2042304 RepID=UPI0010314550|nr:transcription repressor NadR [Gracilibacillus phocaeensis]